MKKRINIFIDADVLVHPHFSGIGHYTASLLRAVDNLLKLNEYSHLNFTLGVPFREAHKLNRFEFHNFSVRKMLITHRIANGLKQKGLLPPIDLFYGKQVYIFPNYSSWPTLFSKSLPVIYDISFVKYPQFGDKRNMEFLVEQVRKSATRASRIITISNNSKSEINEEYNVKNNKIDIIYPVIEMRDFYKRSAQEIAEVKAQYGIFDSYILFVGNLEPRKNLTTLLDAYELLPHKLQKKYALLLVGAKGWNNDDIHNKIRDMRMRGLKIIQPVDYVVDKDIPALISGASAFSWLPVYEGFGIPPVEALACGTPVVCSDNSSLTEAGGDAVTYVNAYDAKEAAVAIEKTLDGIFPDIDKGYRQAKKFNATVAAKAFIESIEKAAL
jgi:glycosyltransferase involved in cell wall biosynthesis